MSATLPDSTSLLPPTVPQDPDPDAHAAAAAADPGPTSLYVSFPAHVEEKKEKTNSWLAKARGWAFLAFLLAVAALSGTVLREPILQSESWLISQGTAGCAVFGVVAWAFIMIGGSSHLIDLISGYVYGGGKGFVLAYVTKLLATTASYFAGRYLFRDMLVLHFVKEYVWLEAMATLVQEKPWLSNVLLRASVIPAAVKSYGLGAIQDPPVPFFTAAVVIMALLSWVLTDLGAKLQDPADIFKAKNPKSKALELVGIISCALVLMAGAYYGRKYVRQIQARKEAELVAVAATGAAVSVEEGSSPPEAEEVLWKKDGLQQQATVTAAA